MYSNLPSTFNNTMEILTLYSHCCKKTEATSVVKLSCYLYFHISTDIESRYFYVGMNVQVYIHTYVLTTMPKDMHFNSHTCTRTHIHTHTQTHRINKSFEEYQSKILTSVGSGGLGVSASLGKNVTKL